MVAKSGSLWFRTLAASLLWACVVVLPANELQAQTCVPKLVDGTDYYNQYKNGVFPSHFDMEGWATATDASLVLRNYTSGKAWRVFWVRWGTVDISTTTALSCDTACKMSTSTTGTSSRTDSIVSASIARAEKVAGGSATIVAATSAALSASGGPTVTVGAAPLTVAFTWPASSDLNTMQMGTFRWMCQQVNALPTVSIPTSSENTEPASKGE